MFFRRLPDKPSQTEDVRNCRGDAVSVWRVGETTGVRGLESARGVSVGGSGGEQVSPSARGIPYAQASASCPSKEERRAPRLLAPPLGRKHEPAALCDSRNDLRSKASTRSAGSRGARGEGTLTALETRTPTVEPSVFCVLWPPRTFSQNYTTFMTVWKKKIMSANRRGLRIT